MTVTLTAFTTTRKDGDARALGGLARILRSRRLSTTFACAEQVHGHRIAVVPALQYPKKYDGADGLLTAESDRPLAIFTADCVPLFLNAGDGRVVGILHAGWRGVQNRILAKAIRLIRKKWNIKPSDIRVRPGPSIGPCCFEVKWDVARYFPSTRRRLARRGLGGSGWTVDLAGELHLQARRLGVRWKGKKSFWDCTMHQFGRFSFRRDGTPKRQVSVIMKRER